MTEFKVVNSGLFRVKRLCIQDDGESGLTGDEFMKGERKPKIIFHHENSRRSPFFERLWAAKVVDQA